MDFLLIIGSALVIAAIVSSLYISFLSYKKSKESAFIGVIITVLLIVILNFPLFIELLFIPPVITFMALCFADQSYEKKEKEREEEREKKEKDRIFNEKLKEIRKRTGLQVVNGKKTYVSSIPDIMKLYGIDIDDSKDKKQQVKAQPAKTSGGGGYSGEKPKSPYYPYDYRDDLPINPPLIYDNQPGQKCSTCKQYDLVSGFCYNFPNARGTTGRDDCCKFWEDEYS